MKIINLIVILSLVANLDVTAHGVDKIDLSAVELREQDDPVVRKINRLVKQLYQNRDLKFQFADLVEKQIPQGEAFLRKSHGLIGHVYRTLQRLEAVDSSSQDFIALKETAFSSYNLLRVLLNVTPITSYKEINKQWLDEVAAEVDYYVMMVWRGFNKATHRQKELLSQAQNALNLDTEISLFTKQNCKEEGASVAFSFMPFIVLCDKPDSEGQRSTLYHELGHVVHHDKEIELLIHMGQMSYETLTQSRSFQASLERVKHYMELGKSALDDTTPVGRHVREVLLSYNSFWELPSDDKAYQQALKSMNRERRADLFMLDNLYKHGHVNSIIVDMVRMAMYSAFEIDGRYFDIQIIKENSFFGYYVAYICKALADYSLKSNIVAEGDATHPSSFERTLYIIGFLSDKGIDVNKALREWYSKGKCVVADTSPSHSFTQALLEEVQLKEGARDFRKAYRLWQAEQPELGVQA